MNSPLVEMPTENGEVPSDVVLLDFNNYEKVQ